MSVIGRNEPQSAHATNVCSLQKRTCGFESGRWVLIHPRHRRGRGSKRTPREVEEVTRMAADELVRPVWRMLMGRIRASLINVEPTQTAPDRLAIGLPLLERSGHCVCGAGMSI